MLFFGFLACVLSVVVCLLFFLGSFVGCDYGEMRNNKDKTNAAYKTQTHKQRKTETKEPPWNGQ